MTEHHNIRIRSIKVTGLFGLYTHEVVLKDEHITVIHGPNGVGKTVFLKLIDAFLNEQYFLMLQTPFEAFELHFDDDNFARITRENSTVMFSGRHLKCDFRSTGTSLKHIEAERQEKLKDHGYLTQLDNETWLDRKTDEILSSDKIPNALGLVLKTPRELSSLIQDIQGHLIETQRLIRFNEKPRRAFPRFRGSTTLTVDEYAQDLLQKVNATHAEYGRVSQKLDQTFPQRLIQATNNAHPNESQAIQLNKDMQDIENTRNRLLHIGVLDQEDPTQNIPLQGTADINFETLEPTQRTVMAVYAKDAKEKLAVLQPLSNKIEILLNILNRKFTNKTVTISRNEGLLIQSANGTNIPLNGLSSGEQHELVLLYDLLFKIQPNTLVMIDEPELSLHLNWQKSFVDDLLEIIRIAQFDVLLATHSPYILGDHIDLLVELSAEPSHS